MALGQRNRAGSNRLIVPARTHAAATATERILLWIPEAAVRITALAHCPDAAITGVDTNTTHLNFHDGGATGTGTTEVANVDYTKGTDAVALTDNDLSATAFNLDAGDSFILQYEKVGTGLLIPEGFIMIDYSYK